MCQDRKFEIVDRPAVFILWLILKLFIPSMLDEIQFGLQSEILFRDPPERKSARVAHFHFLLHFRLGKADLGKSRTEGSSQRQFPFELILRLEAVQGDKAYNSCCNNFPDHLTSFRVTLKSLW